jgi:hypothetical protein
MTAPKTGIAPAAKKQGPIIRPNNLKKAAPKRKLFGR